MRIARWYLMNTLNAQLRITYDYEIIRPYKTTKTKNQQTWKLQNVQPQRPHVSLFQIYMAVNSPTSTFSVQRDFITYYVVPFGN